MTILFLIVLAVLAGLTWGLWKLGSVEEAEHPKAMLDLPVMDAKERKAILKRLKRWRESGKLSREEFEHVEQLCQSEWNEPTT